MEKKYDVCAIGNALVDMAFQVSDSFLEKHGVEKGVMTLVDEKTQSELINDIDSAEVIQDPGGSAANTITTLSQLGGSGFYCCKVANDEFGDIYLNAMQQAGIPTNFDNGQPPEGVTGKCLVMITDDAERTMNSYLGISTTLSVDQIEVDAVRQSRYIYLEGYLVTGDSSFQALKRIKELATDHGIKTALTLSDPAVAEAFIDRFKEIAEGVDLLFCNDEEAKIYTGCDELPEAFEVLQDTAEKFVVTQGGEGATIYDGSAAIQLPPEQVDVVDTNGAGDMFAGCYLYGITHGLTASESGELANRAAAKVVSTYGPRLEKSELQDILAAVV